MNLFGSYAMRWILGVLTFLAAISVLRFKPWMPHSGSTGSLTPREKLVVGFLPVTCHLTCPVTDFATKTSAGKRFESQLLLDFPSMAESMKAGRLQATFMIAPLAMELREQGLPVKILYLGHCDGSTLVVRSDLRVNDLRGLRGKTLAVPSKYSNQYLVIHKLMDDQGVGPDGIRFVEMQPPDMPGALEAKAIDAYFVGEPYPGRAQLDGSGRVLYFAKDIWPHFISCVLVVHERPIHERLAVVKDLVRGIAQGGAWADTHREDAAGLDESTEMRSYQQWASRAYFAVPPAYPAPRTEARLSFPLPFLTPSGGFLRVARDPPEAGPFVKKGFGRFRG